MDNIILDVDKIVFKHSTPVGEIRIMHGSYGYYYMEMSNKDGYRLNALAYEDMKTMIKNIIKDLGERGMTIDD